MTPPSSRWAPHDLQPLYFEGAVCVGSKVHHTPVDASSHQLPPKRMCVPVLQLGAQSRLPSPTFPNLGANAVRYVVIGGSAQACCPAWAALHHAS